MDEDNNVDLLNLSLEEASNKKASKRQKAARGDQDKEETRTAYSRTAKPKWTLN